VTPADLMKKYEEALASQNWVIEQGIAICLYTFSWSGLVNGQPASGQGRGTSVLIEADGTWQIISEHPGPNAV
jgi:ketosteroid isomerase-like protein